MSLVVDTTSTALQAGYCIINSEDAFGYIDWGFNSAGTFPLVGGIEVAAPVTVTVGCGHTGGTDPVQVNSYGFTAVQVAALTDQSP